MVEAGRLYRKVCVPPDDSGGSQGIDGIFDVSPSARCGLVIYQKRKPLLLREFVVVDVGTS